MNTQIHWKTLFLNLTLWLAAEIVLNLTGLDDLSNYSEFIFQQNGFELRRA